MSATDYRLIIESVRGEMRRDGTDDGIDIRSFEYGVEVARDGASGLGRQRRRYSDVKFTKLVDRSSPTIQSMLATNAKIKKATLSVRKAGGARLEYYKLILSEAYISSYRILGADLDDEFGPLPRDEFSINFRRIEVEYTTQSQAGDRNGTVGFMDSLGE